MLCRGSHFEKTLMSLQKEGSGQRLTGEQAKRGTLQTKDATRSMTHMMAHADMSIVPANVKSR
jgi:hypothetical protein